VVFRAVVLGAIGVLAGEALLGAVGFGAVGSADGTADAGRDRTTFDTGLAAVRRTVAAFELEVSVAVAGAIRAVARESCFPAGFSVATTGLTTTVVVPAGAAARRADSISASIL
jgi:hypothetical protein